MDLLTYPLLMLISIVYRAIRPVCVTSVVSGKIVRGSLSIVATINKGVVLVSVIKLVFDVTGICMSSRTSVNFKASLHANLFNGVRRLSFFSVSQFDATSLVAHLADSVDHVRRIVVVSVHLVLHSPLVLIVTIFFIMHVGLRLTNILLTTVPVLNFDMFFVLQGNFPFFLGIRRGISRLGRMMHRGLVGVQIMGSFMQRSFRTRGFGSGDRDLHSAIVRTSGVVISVFPMVRLIVGLSVVTVL